MLRACRPWYAMVMRQPASRVGPGRTILRIASEKVCVAGTPAGGAPPPSPHRVIRLGFAWRLPVPAGPRRGTRGRTDSDPDRVKITSRTKTYLADRPSTRDTPAPSKPRRPRPGRGRGRSAPSERQTRPDAPTVLNGYMPDFKTASGDL